MATTIADTDGKTTAPASTTTPAAMPVTIEIKTAPAAAKPAAPVAKRATKTAAKRAKPVAKRAAKAVKPAKPARSTSRAAKVAVTTPAKSAVTTPAKAAVTNAAKVATTVQKEAKTMASKIDAPKMLNDVNDRAKAAMDKSGQLVSEMTDFSKGNVEALVESSRIAASGLQSIGQEAADYSRKSFEGLTATLKSAASVKSPTELFKLHSDFMRSSFDAAIAEMSKNTEAMLKLAGDAAKPLSTRFAVAADKVKKAA